MQVCTEKQDTGTLSKIHPTHPPKNPSYPFCETENIDVLKGTDSMYVYVTVKNKCT